MADLFLKKTQFGTLVAADEPSMEVLKRYKVGQIIRAKLQVPRVYKDHCRCMALLQLTYENLPERYGARWPTFKAFRRAVAEAAGHVDEYVTLEGEIRRSGRSLSYDSIPDNVDFNHVFADLMAVCTAILDVEEPELAAEVSRYASDHYGIAAYAA